MQHESIVLAQTEGFGSVRRCAHGCVHVQVGFLSMTFSEQQYMQMVAMMTDSAAHFANLEFFRASSEIDESQESGAQETSDAARLDDDPENE